MNTLLKENHPGISLIYASSAPSVCFYDVPHGCRGASVAMIKHIYIQYCITPFITIYRGTIL